MIRIGKSDIYKLVFSATIATALMLIGCGSGGDGTGRQTLPGENPTGPIVIPGTGTGTNTNTGTNTKTGTQTGTQTDIKTPAEMLATGWSVMKDGNYGGSISYFTNVINNSSSTPDQRQQAYNGRGWAKANYYKTTEGFDDFKRSYQLGEINTNSYRESILGYALALIQATGDDNLDRAIQLMATELGLSNPAYVLGIEHTYIGVTSPEAHAMLAYAYFWRGFASLAKAQIEQARIDDSLTNGTVSQIYETLIAAGLYN